MWHLRLGAVLYLLSFMENKPDYTFSFRYVRKIEKEQFNSAMKSKGKSRFFSLDHLQMRLDYLIFYEISKVIQYL